LFSISIYSFIRCIRFMTNILRGRVKFPTGGDGGFSASARDPRERGGFGANPKPTVKVWMGEG
jgi:hypothetical protein